MKLKQMDKIFNPFGYWDLLIIEDGSGKGIKVMMAIITVIPDHTADIVAIMNKVKRSA